MTRKEKIAEAISEFVKGGDYRNISLLEKVLHDDFTVASHGFMGKPDVTLIDKKQYITYVKDGIFGGLPRKITIERIDYFGPIAQVALRLESSLNDFVSVNALVENAQGDWQLLHNLAIVQPRKQLR